MRTTVKIKPEHRSALLILAARRGQKGISALIEEAIESYLAAASEQEKRRRNFLSLAGSLSEEHGEELLREVERLRGQWR